ncbi:MAG: MCE family protein [Phycisphaerae bacterium]|nr:MCE family protein [Phycisphaerae bacterium]
MTDYQTKQRQHNLIVGGFVIIAFFAFVYLLLKFRDLPLFVSKFQSFEILVNFPEAPGIQKDTPVNYCGVQIGRVRHVADPQVTTADGERKMHKVGVTISINDDFKDIPDDVEIVIMKRGLGSSYIELRDTGHGEPEGFLGNEMVREGSIAMASEFFPPDVQKKLENLVDSIAALANNMNEIIGDSNNQTNVKKVLENVASATAQAREMFASVQKFSDTGTEKVDILSEKVGGVAEQLEGALSEMRQLMAKIDAGEGTAGKMVNDGRLYENLIESSHELELMLEQLKQWAADAREKGIRIKW